MKPYASGKDWTLYHGDCLEVLPTLSGIDAVVTDPPWNMDFFVDDDKPWEEYAKWLGNVKGLCESASTKGVWIFQSTKAIPHVAHLFGDYSFFASAKNFCQMTKKKIPNAWDIAMYLDRGAYLGNGRNWHIGNTAGMLKDRTAHPTPRPLDTMEYIIGMHDWKSVLDPFTGSGTTGVACIRTGRKFIGIELDEGYCEIAARRMRESESHLFANSGASNETNP